MPIVPATCTQCGAKIEVDDAREAGICSYCGTAFVTEKAVNKYNNNITNNINVNTSGNTINITQADKSNEYIAMARKCKETGDDEKAEKFYTLALEGQPDSWEANFYSTFYAVKQSKIVDIPRKTKQINSCLIISTDLLHNSNEENVLAQLTEMQDKLYLLTTMLFSSYRLDHVKKKAQSGLNLNYAAEITEYNCTIKEIIGIPYSFGDQLIKYYSPNQDIAKIAVDSWKKALSFRKIFAGDFPVFLKNGEGDSKESVQAEIDLYAKKIQEFEPSYVPPKAYGCYIATCVYGSYDCPEVWTLRRFRDNTLSASSYGRAFIRCYYTISPTLVKWFGRTNLFQRFWKTSLDKLVKILNEQGVDSTAYTDNL